MTKEMIILCSYLKWRKNYRKEWNKIKDKTRLSEYLVIAGLVIMELIAFPALYFYSTSGKYALPLIISSGGLFVLIPLYNVVAKRGYKGAGLEDLERVTNYCNRVRKWLSDVGYSQTHHLQQLCDAYKEQITEIEDKHKNRYSGFQTVVGSCVIPIIITILTGTITQNIKIGLPLNTNMLLSIGLVMSYVLMYSSSISSRYSPRSLHNEMKVFRSIILSLLVEEEQ